MGSAVGPQQGAGGRDVEVQLQAGSAADGHAGVVLDLQSVLHVVGLGNGSSVVYLQTNGSLSGPPPRSERVCLWFLPWFCSGGLRPGRSGFRRTAQVAGPGRCVYADLPANHLRAEGVR